MHSTKHILDGFYAMRLLSQRHDTVSAGERALLIFTAEERARLCLRICHVFQALASCIMLEYPLTDAIPTIDTTKDQFLGKIYQFRRDHMKDLPKQAQSGDADRSTGRYVDDEVNRQASFQVQDNSRQEVGGDATGLILEEKDYALVYAYMLVTAQVADELKRVRMEIEGLFGILNQEELLLE